MAAAPVSAFRMVSMEAAPAVSALRMLSIVTLKDGSQVPREVFKTTMSALDSVKKANQSAVVDLLRVSKSFYGSIVNKNSIMTLRKYALIDKEGKVNDTVKKIVQNAASGEGVYLIFVDPRRKT